MTILRFSLTLVITLNGIFSYPYRKSQQQPPAHSNYWHDENHQSMNIQQPLPQFYYPGPIINTQEYHVYQDNTGEQEGIVNPFDQIANIELESQNQHETEGFGQQSVVEFESEQQSNLDFGSQQQDLTPDKYVNAQDIESDLQQQTNIEFGSQNLEERAQKYSHFQRGQVPIQQTYHELRSLPANKPNKYTNELVHQESEQQSQMEFGTHQVQTTDYYNNNQDIANSQEKHYNIDFSSQKTQQSLSEQNDMQETKGFGQQSVAEFESEQQVQTSNYYTSDQDTEIEQQSNQDFGFQQQDIRPNKYVNAQDTETDVQQQTNIDFGSQNLEGRAQKYSDFRRGIIPVQQTDHELGSIPEHKPRKFINEQEYQESEPKSELEFGTHQVQTTDNYKNDQIIEHSYDKHYNIEFSSEQTQQNPSEQNEMQETEGFGQQSVAEFESEQQVQTSNYYTSDPDAGIEQQSNLDFGSQQQDLRPNKYVNAQDTETYVQQQTNIEFGSQNLEQIGHQYSDLQGGKTPVQQQTDLELGSIPAHNPNKYTNEQQHQESEQQSELEFGTQQVQTSQNYKNDQNIENSDDKHYNIEVSSQQTQQNPSEQNDMQETEGFGQQSVAEFESEQQVQTSNYYTSDQNAGIEQQSNLDFGSQQQDLRPNKYVNAQDTETYVQQQTNIEFESQNLEHQYSDLQGGKPQAQQQTDLELGSIPAHKPNKYTNEQHQESEQQSELEFGTQHVQTSQNYKNDQNIENSDDKHYNIEFLSQQTLFEQNEKQDTEPFGQQSVAEFESEQQVQTSNYYTSNQNSGIEQQSNLDFGSQQHDLTPNKYVNAQDTETDVQQQTNIEFGSIPEHKPNIYGQYPTIVQEKQSRVKLDGEKDSYECLNVKVDNLEKDLSSILDVDSTTFSSNPINQPMSRNNNNKEEDTLANNANINKPQIKNDEQFIIMSTISPEDLKESPKKGNFWNKIQDKMSETYIKLQNKASDVVEKVKNRLSTTN